MRALNCILSIFCLFFMGKATAQNAGIVSLEKKKSTLSTTENRDLEYLRAGTPHKLFLTRENGALYTWNKGKGVEVVEFEDISLLQELKNARHAKDFHTAQLLIINWNNEKNIGITEGDLDGFNSLRYVLIRSNEPLNETTVNDLVRPLRSSGGKISEIEILFETQEEAN